MHTRKRIRPKLSDILTWHGLTPVLLMSRKSGLTLVHLAKTDHQPVWLHLASPSSRWIGQPDCMCNSGNLATTYLFILPRPCPPGLPRPLLVCLFQWSVLWLIDTFGQELKSAMAVSHSRPALGWIATICPVVYYQLFNLTTMSLDGV